MVNDRKELNMGIVGCGWITSSIKMISKFIRGIKIISAADVDISRAIKIAGKKNACSSIEDIVNDAEVDFVYIATPHNLHGSMIKQAIEAGKHVLCEKPVSTSMETAREIKKLCDAHPDFKVGFNYNYRYDHKLHQLAMGVRNGHLGRIYYATCDVLFHRTSKYFTEGTWRAKQEQSGGGTLLIHGSHMLDILVWTLGTPRTVFGKIDTLQFKETEVEDVALGTIEFENESYAQINCASIITPRPSLFGDCVKLTIYGEKGTVNYKGPWPSTKIQWKGVKKYKTKKEIKGFSHLGRSLKAYASWINGDSTYYNTIEESSKALSIVKAFYRSSHSGCKENIESL